MPTKEKGPVFRVTGFPASQLNKKLAVLLKATINDNLIEDERSKPDPSIAIFPSYLYTYIDLYPIYKEKNRKLIVLPLL